MPRVADLVNHYSDSTRRGGERMASGDPTSTVARLVRGFEDNLRDIDGARVAHSGEPPSLASPSTSRGPPDVANPHRAADANASHHQYPNVNKPSLYANQRTVNGSSNSKGNSRADADERPAAAPQRPGRNLDETHAFHHREPSNSSTIRSSWSTSSSSPSPSDTCDALPALEQGRAPSALRANPLPKAKVVIARRRPESASIDYGVEGFGAPSFDPRNDAASAPMLPSLFPSAAPATLVTEYSDPAELHRGRVSLINLMETNAETVVPEDDADFDFGDRTSADAARGAEAARKPRFNYDDFMDAEEMGAARAAAGLQQTAPYQTAGSRAGGRKPGKARFLRRIVGGGREDPTAGRHSTRREDIQRRSTMVSGAIDRISIAADPFVDFITSGGPAGAPPKNRFSKFMSRLFGEGARQRKLVKH